MDEYEVELGNGVKTTMQLDDEAAKAYPGAKKVRKASGVEVTADVSRPASRKTRGSGKETR